MYGCESDKSGTASFEELPPVDELDIGEASFSGASSHGCIRFEGGGVILTSGGAEFRLGGVEAPSSSSGNEIYGDLS